MLRLHPVRTYVRMLLYFTTEMSPLLYSKIVRYLDHWNLRGLETLRPWGLFKTWTLDCGLDRGLDYGLDYGLD